MKDDDMHEQRELPAGTKIRMLVDNSYYAKGDVAVIRQTPPVRSWFVPGNVRDSGGHYWADFNGMGNTTVKCGKVLCVD